MTCESLHSDGGSMEHQKRIDVRHTTRYCASLTRDVRVLLRKQPDGTWKLVRCLDTVKECAGQSCPLLMAAEGRCFDESWV